MIFKKVFLYIFQLQNYRANGIVIKIIGTVFGKFAKLLYS